MCIQKAPSNWSGKLYYAYKECVEEYLRAQVLPRVKTRIKAGGDALLPELAKRWDNHVLQLKWLSRFFNYINRFYVKRRAIPTLWEVGVTCFKEVVFEDVKGAASLALIAAINRERSGELLDRAVLRSCANVFVAMGGGTGAGLEVYEQELEGRLLESTAQYCREQSNKWLRQCGCPEYLDRAETLLKTECARVDAYLHASTKDKLMRVCERELLVQHQDRVLDMPGSGVMALLAQDDGRGMHGGSGAREHLSRTFRLYQRIDDRAREAAKNAKWVRPKRSPVADANGTKENGGDETAASNGARGGDATTTSATAGATTTDSVNPGLQPVADRFRRHISEEGGKLVRHVKVAPPGKGGRGDASGSTTATLVPRLVTLHERYMAICERCFKDHPLFHKALKEAFEKVMNVALPGKRTMAELVSAFLDQKLRKGSDRKAAAAAAAGGGPMAATVTEAVEQVVRLFVYLAEKDVFAEFYKKQLAKRLLLGCSAGEDAEKLVVARLKKQCGAQFTSKLEGMVKDMMLSRGVQGNFAAHLVKQQTTLPCEASVTVLTRGFWPTYKMDTFRLPEEITATIAEFTAFYVAGAPSRQLTWVHSLGVLTVQGAFKAGKKIDLVVSTVQGCVLLLFNHFRSLTLKELCKALKLSEQEVVRHVTPLALGRYKILHKVPEVPQPKPTDVYSVNAEFTDRARRIKVPLMVRKGAKAQARKAAIVAVTHERRHAVEAAIVRTMKARKTLAHAALLKEVQHQLRDRFIPEAKGVKERIDDLISREYMEPKEGEDNVYVYVA